MKKYPLPAWANPLLQGLTFWIGYKKQQYRHYPLSEGALIGEAVNLIYSNIALPEKLKCEVMYKDLQPSVSSLKNRRADIIISDAENTKYVIEVKREQSSKTKIKEDLIKLAEAKKSMPNTRCFLLLVSQRKRPEKYVKEDGDGVDGKIVEENYSLRVRRVCKAASTFKNSNSANYACLIEVEPNLTGKK